MFQLMSDGDDNTQLSQNDVVGYINGSQVNLGSGSQVDTSSILTESSTLEWSKLNGIPSDLEDGDNDSFATTSCSDGQILHFDSSSNSWTCGEVSDSDTLGGLNVLLIKSQMQWYCLGVLLLQIFWILMVMESWLGMIVMMKMKQLVVTLNMRL